MGRVLGAFWEVIGGLGGFGGFLAACWAGLGRILGDFGGVLVAFWGVLGGLGRVGGFLGASWGVSGRISGGKVANMAPAWLPKWSQDGPKFDPKTDHFLMPLGVSFRTNCG